MDSGQQALIFFYGVFWATVVAATSPYRGFATALALAGKDPLERRNARRRLLVAVLLLNGLPAVLLYYLYECVVAPSQGGRAVLAAAVASLSVFGIHRIFHAVVCSKETCSWFYTDTELTRFGLKDEEKSGSPWWAHLVPGLIYLFGAPVLAKVIQ